jgi:hypothetical protein
MKKSIGLLIILLLLPVSFAQAVESKPNVLEKVRSLKATKIAQLTQDCNDTQKELEKCMRARIVPERNRSSRDSTRENYQKPTPLTYPSREDKRAAIDALQEKIEILQQNLARAEANDLNIIIENVFREPFAVGQIGKIHFDKEHPLQRMRINSIIDKNNCLVDFKISELPRGGHGSTQEIDTGQMSLHAMAMEPAPTLATLEEDYRNPLSIIKTIWLKEFNTSGKADGSEIVEPLILIITGTRTIPHFTDTVYVFEPLEIPANAL